MEMLRLSSTATISTWLDSTFNIERFSNVVILDDVIKSSKRHLSIVVLLTL